MENVQEQFPGVLLTQLVIMDSASDEQKPWIPDGSLLVPLLSQSDGTTMYALFSTLIGKLLGEMAGYAEQVRSWATVATPLSLQAQTQRFDGERRPRSERRISDRSHLSNEDSPSGDRPRYSSPRPTSQAFGSPSTSVASSPRPDSPSLRSEAPSSPDLSNVPTPTSSTAPEAMWKAKAKYASMQSDKPSGRSLYPATNVSMSAEKEKKIGQARVGIVMGSLYLMAGRWSDAWRELVEATAKCRSNNDYIWLASGLERVLVCMLLLGAEGFDFQIPSFCYLGQERQSTLYFIDASREQNTTISPRDPTAANTTLRKLASTLGEVVNTLLHYYDRAGTFTGEALPQVAFSEMVLRLTKLQSFVATRGSTLADEIFQDGRLDALRRPIGAKDTSDMSRLGISEILFRAYPGPFADISSPSRSAVLAGISAVLSALKMHRKRAMVLKDLITLLVPSLQQARTLGAAELGIHPSSNLPLADGNDKVSASDASSLSIRQLLSHLLEVYAVSARESPDDHLEDIEASSSGEEGGYERLIHATTQATARLANLDKAGSANLKIDILRSSIEFCESLGDLSGIAQNAALLLRTAGPQASVDPTQMVRHVHLANEEQVLLANHIMTAVHTAREAGTQIDRPRYWDDFLVRSVQMVEDDSSSKLVEHSKADMNTVKKGPFLHDAWGKNAKKEEENITVAGESTFLGVVMQNPYDFEIEIDEITIVAEGGVVELDPPNAILGPGRLQEVVCVARVAEAAQLRILGCKVRMAGCREQFFPIYNDEWVPEDHFKIKEASREVGLRNETITDDDSADRAPQPSQMALTVIQSQPTLVLDKMELTDTSLMLVEGETQSFRIVFLNTSNIDVDFLRLSFEDALTSSLRSAATSKDLSRAEMYEIEANLTQEPFFSAIRVNVSESQSQVIRTGETATFEVSITGRASIKDVRILLDYARLDTELAESSGRFFTRQLAMPVSVTVSPGLQVQHFEISSLPLDVALEGLQLPAQSERLTMNGSLATSHSERDPSPDSSNQVCLLVIGIRNGWTNPIAVKFELSPSTRPVSLCRDVQYQQTILPGQTHRFVMPMRKLYVHKAYAQIPWLSTQSRRQFVVSTGGGDTLQQELAMRELFWYREKLLESISCQWHEQGSSRYGMVSLRSIRMGHRIVEALKLDDLDIVLRVHNTGDHDEVGGTISRGGMSFDVRCGDYLSVTTTLHNRSDRRIHGVLRLLPMLAEQSQDESMELVSRRFIWSGLLQQPFESIEPGQRRTQVLNFSIVTEGIYEVGAVVEEIRPAVLPPLDKADDGPDDDELDEASTASSSERRIWKSSEPCTIRAQPSQG
ncbi:hypothetical protein CAC42_1376 [Sphaceloma murrayae]|uniref:Transport protein particle subunit trs120 n=1 Tax=Sphaceloma murrayae TaxID=2082308 RepID=A0A2K1QFM6_9PEZI|nr:hypothetical protein CAC42_1376 [Sphaceloma murrayae]